MQYNARNIAQTLTMFRRRRVQKSIDNWRIKKHILQFYLCKMQKAIDIAANHTVPHTICSQSPDKASFLLKSTIFPTKTTKYWPNRKKTKLNYRKLCNSAKEKSTPTRDGAGKNTSPRNETRATCASEPFSYLHSAFLASRADIAVAVFIVAAGD